MTYVERIAEDGLSKVRFGFDLQGNHLQYVEHYQFHRDSVDELWGDQWPAALSYEKWCSSHNMEPCHCYCKDEYCCLYQRYEQYCKTMNPVCQKTKDGKVKMMGRWCLKTEVLPPCPDEVAAEALISYVKSLTVQTSSACLSLTI